MQAKNRNLEEKNKKLMEKCEQFSEGGKQIKQQLSTLLKSYQPLEKTLNDVTAEKGTICDYWYTSYFCVFY